MPDLIRIGKRLVRRSMIQLGLPRGLVAPAEVRRIELPYAIGPDQLPGYVQLFDSYDMQADRVAMRVPDGEIQPREEFLREAQVVVELCHDDLSGDSHVLGYNVVLADQSPPPEAALLAARAASRAMQHLREAFGALGNREQLVVVTNPVYGKRTIVYHWRGLGRRPPSSPAAIRVVSRGMVGSSRTVGSAGLD